MTNASSPESDAIRSLNDAFRRTFTGGVVLLTAGVEALPDDVRQSLLKLVREFDAFTPAQRPAWRARLRRHRRGWRPLLLEDRHI